MNKEITALVAVAASFLIAVIMAAFNVDEEVWEKIDNSCYLRVHSDRSLFHDDTTTRVIYCVKANSA